VAVPVEQANTSVNLSVPPTLAVHDPEVTSPVAVTVNVADLSGYVCWNVARFAPSAPPPWLCAELIPSPQANEVCFAYPGVGPPKRLVRIRQALGKPRRQLSEPALSHRHGRARAAQLYWSFPPAL